MMRTRDLIALVENLTREVKDKPETDLAWFHYRVAVAEAEASWAAWLRRRYQPYRSAAGAAETLRGARKYAYAKGYEEVEHEYAMLAEAARESMNE